MPRRRLIIIVVSVLLGFTLVAALAAPDADQATKPDQRPRVGAMAPSVPGSGEEGVVRAELPDGEAVRAQVGDLVEITVTSEAPDSVAIADLALAEAVAPGAPALLSFLADRPGTFPVTLDLAERRIGRIIVQEAEPEGSDEDEDEDEDPEAGPA